MISKPPTFLRLGWLLLASAAALALACGAGGSAPSINQVLPTATVRPGASAAGIPTASAPAPPLAPQPTATCGAGEGSIGAIQRTGERKYTAPPKQVIDTSKNYTAVLETDKGRIDLILATQDVPNTVNNFVFLACSGYYDGLIFHRVVANPPVAQGGDPLGNGSGGPGYRINDEINLKWRHDTGALAMARTAEPNTAGSQFYITLASQPGLDGGYTVFGKVTAGMEVVRALRMGDHITRIQIEQR